MNKAVNVRVRFAPSPTGWVHIGNLRTILFDYLFARQNKGSFVLRIEDTDQKRKVDKGIEGIEEVFSLLQIEPDESPSKGGKYGPYIQTQRQESYDKAIKVLLDKKVAYHCFCTQERLDELREKQRLNKQKPKYDGHCRNLTEEEVKDKLDANEPYVIRMKVPEQGTTELDDIVYGNIKFKNVDLDDQVLIKTNGIPTYHFANVVDDHEMEMSHITRADEWLSSTPKHIILYNYFGWKIPKFAHMPMVLNPDGKGKLSKRNGDVAVIDFLRRGYLREGLFNFLALLGWTPTPDKIRQDEIYSLDDLTELFSLDRVKKSAARFDIRKLESINAHWLRAIPEDDFIGRLTWWMREVVLKELIADQVRGTPDWVNELRAKVQKLGTKLETDQAEFKQLLPLVRERARTLVEVVDSLSWWYQDTTYNADDFTKFGDINKTTEAVQKLHDTLESTDSWDQEPWEQAIRKLADDLGWKHGDLFMLLRLAITGSKVSPPLREIMVVLGKPASLGKIQGCIDWLKQQ